MSQEWINLALVIIGIGVFSAILGSLTALLDKYERKRK
jgi:hypothetical protein